MDRIRASLWTVGTIVAVLLMLLPTASASAVAGTPAKAGALAEAGRAFAYVPFGVPRSDGGAFALIRPPALSAPGAVPAASGALPAIAAASHTTSPRVAGRATGLGQPTAGGTVATPSIGVSSTTSVEVASTWARIQNATTGTVTASFSLATFFGISTSDVLSESRVLYDQTSKRWLISTLDATTNVVHFAVSKTSNASAAYYNYTLVSTYGNGPQFMNFPHFGVSATYWALSTDIYNASTVSFVGNVVTLLGKTKLDSGTLLGQAFGSSNLTVMPEVALSNNGSGTPTMYAASTGTYSQSSSLTVWEYQGTVPHATAKSVVYSVSSTGIFPTIPQSGTTVTIANIGDRVTSASWSFGGGVLWVSYTAACTPAGDGSTRTCVRVDAVATATNTLKQDSNVAVAGSYLFAPSLTALRTGPGYLMMFGFTSGLSFPSLAIAGQNTSDGFGTYRGPIPVVSGLAYDAVGDAEYETGTQFFQAGTAPTAWSAGATNGPSGWQTELIHSKF